MLSGSSSGEQFLLRWTGERRKKCERRLTNEFAYLKNLYMLFMVLSSYLVLSSVEGFRTLRKPLAYGTVLILCFVLISQEDWVSFTEREGAVQDPFLLVPDCKSDRVERREHEPVGPCRNSGFLSYWLNAIRVETWTSLNLLHLIQCKMAPIIPISEDRIKDGTHL